MRLAIRHTATGAKSLEDAFQQVAQLAVEGMEVVYNYAGDAADLGEDDYAKELTSLAENYGVAAISLDLNFLCAKPSLIGSDEDASEARELIGRALSTAAAAGAAVVLVPFFGKNTIETEAELQAAGEAMLDLVDLAGEADVVLGIESTLNRHRQRFLLDFLGNTPDVKIYFNTAVATARKLDVATVLRDLGRERLGQVHFQDVRLTPGEPPDYGVPLGEGDVDLRAVTQSLRAIGYEGWIVLESLAGDESLDSTTADLVFARSVLGS